MFSKVTEQKKANYAWSLDVNETQVTATPGHWLCKNQYQYFLGCLYL
jgi:hypothetical protein